MIAVDTSVMIDFFQGVQSVSTARLKEHLVHSTMVFPPLVITEIFSNLRQRPPFEGLFDGIKMLEITDGYWVRAGQLRSAVLAAGFKSRLGDALIAQSCIDYDTPLLTTDADFRHYEKIGGLKLA